MGFLRVSLAILGDELSSQIKFFIILFRVSSVSFGIPWAWVRNCVCPPTTICIIIFLPLRVGCTFLHLSSLVLILSMIGSQGVRSLVLFPIHAPNIHIASPSFAILMPSGSGIWSLRFSSLIVAAFSRCSSFLIGMISVFSWLNLASDIWHHSSRIVWMSWK